MGLGDEIMATAEAWELFQKTGKKVLQGTPRCEHWSEVFLHNPSFRQPNDGIDPSDCVYLDNFPGNRPYAQFRGGKAEWKNWRPKPGKIFLTPEEKVMAWERLDSTIYGETDELVIVEPNVKGTVSSRNKDWGFRKWVELQYRLEDIENIVVVQLVPDPKPAGYQELLHVDATIHTETFREAMAILSYASLFVGTDGGLHHAAAALSIPAVVIWGGYSSPRNLGYPTQRNIYHDHPLSPCGNLRDCGHCREAMEKITVEEVYTAIEEELPDS